MALFNRMVCSLSSRCASWKPSLVGPNVPGTFVVRCLTHSNYSSSLSKTKSSDLKSRFMQVYDSLKYDLLHDPLFEFDDDSRQWVERMIDYNVPGGKMTRGHSVVDSYKLFKGGLQLTDDEIFLASALGWCIEWIQGYILVHDDIMDGSYKRRGHPCWFRLPEVNMVAVNDGVLLANHVRRILKKYFHEKAYYVQLLELFNEAEFQTISGQMIDTIIRNKDLSKYSLSCNRRIIQYKSSYYSFYLPVACALLMLGENPDDYVQMKDILVEMGIYYQIQDDYLDTFGDPNVVGKIGSDIENKKCSWLIAKALELASEEQKKILYDNYGIKDQVRVANVKELYHTLNLQGVFEEYEKETHEELMNSIESLSSNVVQAVLRTFMEKIYQRQK